jgi:zinc transporter
MTGTGQRAHTFATPRGDAAGAPPSEHVRLSARLESGLICGYSFAAGTATEPVRAGDLLRALEQSERVVWLHFNASDAGARRWLEQSRTYPPRALRAVLDRETRCRMEAEGEGILVVLNDLTFEDQADPEEVATLWAYATTQRLVTARAHPLKSSDRLRSAARAGEIECSGFALLARLLELQLDSLATLVNAAAEELNHIEDWVLGGRISEQQARLGRVRRLVAHVRRHFEPQRAAMARGLLRLPASVTQEDAERLRSAGDELSALIDSAAGLHDRAKLLQEELASRIAEETNRNLYVLTIFSAIVMPMNLIAGVFGMNVAGLPGTENPASFLWAMLLIVFSGAGTMLALRVKRLL